MEEVTMITKKKTIKTLGKSRFSCYATYSVPNTNPRRLLHPIKRREAKVRRKIRWTNGAAVWRPVVRQRG